MKDLFAGAFSYFRAISIIHKARLWSYFLMPGIISIFFAGLIVGGVVLSYNTMGDWAASAWPWAFGKTWVDNIVSVIYSIAVLGVSALLYRYILIILLGPFLSPMSQRIEEYLTGKKYPTPTFQENVSMMWRGIRVALRLVFWELLFTLIAYIFLLVPGVNVIVPFVVIAIQGYYAGLGNMDFTFERRYNVRQSVAMGKKYRMLALGNGIIYILMTISIIGIFFAPILSVAALTVELTKRLEPNTPLTPATSSVDEIV